eukprot:TRINITY_DN56460_c0_g1_i1.p1 TRINITY_DN56460_c0_g1~~TRINITY_DN56460_c0_g1_i1.p1  ORF type:complete len:290 (+),score=38.34 TRINITY_DN56460_c0_g1_i1:93-872(+)
MAAEHCGAAPRHFAAVVVGLTAFAAGVATAVHRQKREQRARTKKELNGFDSQATLLEATASAAAALPAWLRWLAHDPGYYCFLLREWSDVAWRQKCGWQGVDLIHRTGSAVHVPCYYYSCETRTLQGPAVFGTAAESHRGLCHGGAMTSVIDDVLGHVGILSAGMGPWNGATVQVNCQLKKPVCIGQTLLVRGCVSRQEGRKVFVEATLLDEAGDTYATGEGVVIAGAKLQKVERDVDRRTWIFDTAHRAVYDSEWHVS